MQALQTRDGDRQKQVIEAYGKALHLLRPGRLSGLYDGIAPGALVAPEVREKGWVVRDS